MVTMSDKVEINSIRIRIEPEPTQVAPQQKEIRCTKRSQKLRTTLVLAEVFDTWLPLVYFGGHILELLSVPLNNKRYSYEQRHLE